jgi:4-oxalomesaconate tautomerase
MLKSIPCTIMRGGTSKGLYFNGGDLPSDRPRRDRVLLAAMGSPDPRQIDGLGGAHPLTSKVAVVSPSSRPDADVDYLFLQVSVAEALVSDTQNCGNILAGIGPYAIENGLVPVTGPVTPVRIHMVNTRSVAVARVETPGGRVEYEGDARIDGVPGTAAAIPIEFLDTAGSSCGSLFPTGRVVDRVDGVDVTCIDNGMPVVLIAARDLDRLGTETPEALEQDPALAARVERIRLELGPRMDLGDVRTKTVPKMGLVSPPAAGGTINTRMFIPHRVHDAIGVLGAVSVATACVVPGSVAQRESRGIAASGTRRIDVEHPTGFFTVELDIGSGDGIGGVVVNRSALLRTARKLMRGELFVPARAWEPA